ncbi:MAG: antitoxin family protein [Armatimonadetes bacterium]|nr:antitoxin family protein [Armatimonadota bacterium]
MRKIRVKYRRGVFEPVEPVNLPEEEEAEVIVPEEPAWPEGASEENIRAGYDPEKVRRALRERTGIFSESEAEELIANIYRWREEGSRPAGSS